MKIRLFLFIFILFSLTGCRGLTDTQLEIRCNSIGLEKIPLDGSGIKSSTSVFAFSSSRVKNWTKRRDDNLKKTFEIFGVEEWSLEVNFCGEDYYLLHRPVCSDPPANIIMIRKRDMQIVQKFDAGGVVEFCAWEIQMDNVPYLVIYNGGLRRRNRSMLIMVDSSCNIVYQECLAKAFEIGYAHSDTYGTCIIVSSGTDWRPDEWGKGHNINGDWVYYLPSNKSPAANE
ncbi:MAG: hypothetical protein MJ033_04585 [Victivallaceae bacterium]|nr:hypothetical protein [Victivallaceae bacterium]